MSKTRVSPSSSASEAPSTVQGRFVTRTEFSTTAPATPKQAASTRPGCFVMYS
jgi:hypothetical protein